MDPVTSVTGDDADSVDSVTGEDTTKPAYWLNFRFFMSGFCIFVVIIASLRLVWKCEGSCKSRDEPQEENPQKASGTVYMEDAWKTCYKSVNPGFLLSYRLLAFCVLLGLLISEVIVNGGGIFLFYTQWTFTLLTIYFGLALMLSVYGCCHGSDTMWNEMTEFGVNDPELGTNRPHNGRTAGFWGYTFQILYQTCGGAVTLTDVVYWLILYKGSKLNFLAVCMHSVNAICFLGDLVLNNLKFPCFRIAYFLLWTCTFVIFQWILHACSQREWPYQFLDLSSHEAPLWYLGIAVLHLPCFGVISIFMKIKQFCLSRHDTESYSNVT